MKKKVEKEKKKKGPDAREALSIDSQLTHGLLTHGLLPPPLTNPPHQLPQQGEEKRRIQTPQNVTLSAQLPNPSPSHVSSWRRSLTPSWIRPSEKCPDWSKPRVPRYCQQRLSAFRGPLGLEGAAGMAWVGLRVRLLGGVWGLGAAELWLMVR